MRPHGSRDRAPIPSEPDPARGSPALGAGGVWVAAAAAAAGVGSAYWDDSWHTTLGRDSTFIPPHLLLYASILTVGVVIAGWGWRRLAATRSVAAVFRTPGFALAVAAAVATAAARSIAPCALFCDLNSVAPQTKRAAAQAIEAAGGHYVDVAVMAPVDPARLTVPLLLSVGGANMRRGGGGIQKRTPAASR